MIRRQLLSPRLGALLWRSSLFACLFFLLFIVLPFGLGVYWMRPRVGV